MENDIQLRRVKVIRYVTPLREGGSLPAIVDADDDFLYVLKFRGAGQGVKALIAEIIGGELARALGLRIPEMVFAELDEAFGRTEPDEEIQDLLRASEGLNLGMHYLSGAITFDPVLHSVDTETASKIVWLDCLLMNVDRTARNTNMLMWNKQLWLIDHGASLYFHHSWDNWEEQSKRPFAQIKDHVLLPYASKLEEINEQCKALVTKDLIQSIIDIIPADWLTSDPTFSTAEEYRDIYKRFLENRLLEFDIIVKQAQYARTTLI